MPSPRKQCILRLDPDLIARADKVRGGVPFNAWVTRLIEDACATRPAAVAAILGSDIALSADYNPDPSPPEPPKAHLTTAASPPRFIDLPMGRAKPDPGSMLKGFKKK